MDERIPVVGVDYPRTHQQLVAWFCPEEDCLEYLARLRWPGGFVCPACGGDKSWRTARRGMWMCSGCGRQTSVTAGTIFHRSHTPLATWFAAIWFVCASKNGVSATTLQQVLGLGRIRLARATAKNSDQLVDFAHQDIAPGSHIRTDGARNLRQLGEQGFTHGYRVLISSVEPAHEYLPGVHLAASLLKRWIAGTLHHGISTRQLDYYLDEFTFRFNRRASRSRGLLFYRLLQQAVATDPHPLTTLIGGTENKP